MKLKEIFNISYGNHKYHNKSNLIPGKIPLFSSKGTNNGFYGYYNIESKYVKCITCPCTGSICEASYHNYPMDADDNTLVLVPKKELTEVEILYYTVLVRKLKIFYCFGRQVTPKRLGNTEVPDKVPDWVYKIDESKYTFKSIKFKNNPKTILPENTKLFKITDLFDIKTGTNLDLNKLKIDEKGIPFVSRTKENNGISARVKKNPNIKTLPSGSITIPTVGSILECFIQLEEYYSSQNIFYAVSKQEISLNSKFYIITLIRANQFKYNYGRPADKTLKNITIPLPVKDDNVDWVYIDNFMKNIME